jgi:hypothetical protein
MTESRLSQLLHALVDGWCERRALEPLAALLPAYLSFNGLTDGWLDLWDAVNNVRGSGPGTLTDEERAAVAEVRSIIYQSLKSVGRAPQ